MTLHDFDTAERPRAMTARAEILHNRADNETFVFDGPEEAGATDRFRVVLGKGGRGGGNALVHVHPGADEIFEVASGRLTVVIDGREHLLEAGQTATVRRGSPHHFRNGHDGATEFVVRFSPPQRQQQFFRNFARLAVARPDWFSPSGDPRLLLIALVLNAYRGHLYLSGPPIPLQKLLFAILAPIARWRGYRLAVVPEAAGDGAAFPAAGA